MNQDEINSISQVIREAGLALLQFFPGRAGGREFQVHRKSDGSPVTDADLLSDKIIRGGIQQIFPDDLVVTEESPISPDTPRKQYSWVVDPLDGTNSFIHGVPDFCVLAARCRDGKAIYGVMYFPALELFAWGAEGRGAFLNSDKLSVSEAEDLRAGGLYLRGVEGVETGLVTTEKLHSGSAFLALCRGTLDGVILEAKRFGEHDYAAPSVILEQSGGKITDETGAELHFSLQKPTVQYLVCSNGRTHDRLMNFLKK